jgi:hypothetical protein
VSNFVSTYQELAKELGVTPRAINQWKERHDDWPRPKADGRHSVKAWKDWMLKHNLKHSADDAAEDESQGEGNVPDGLTVAGYKAIQEKQKARILKQKADLQAGKLLDRSKVEKHLGSILTSFRKSLDGIAPRVAKIISGKMDYERKVEIVQHEVDNAMRVMEAAGTITDA